MATSNTPAQVTRIMESDFNTATLTESVNAAPVSLDVVSKSGIFMDRPMATTKVKLEKIDETLSLVQATPRGAPPEITPRVPRSEVSFTATHLQTRDTLLAASWQDRAGFGQSGAPASLLQERDRILGVMRRRIEATIGFMKTRALFGQVLDANGAVLIDLGAEFGVAPQTLNVAFSNNTTNVNSRIVAARRLAEPVLGLAPAQKWLAFCDATFFDALTSHSSIQGAFANWQAAQSMVSDNRAGFVVGDVEFREVPNLAGKTYIDAGTAIVCPFGVPELCNCWFAPGDTIDDVNMEALPIYARSEFLDFRRGIAIEAESNPLPIVSRLNALVKLTAV